MIYVDIAQQIKNDIVEGKYSAHEKLPTEKELCEQFNTSKMTVRKATDLLIKSGLIFAIPKKGFYVNSEDEIKSFNMLVGGSFHFMNKDKHISTKVITFNKIKAREFLASKFDISSDDYVIHISRIRYLDEKPHTVEDIYMPTYLFDDIAISDVERSIYQYVESKGYEIGINRKNISANVLPSKYSVILPQLGSIPMLQVENTGYLYNGTCFEYSISYQINQEMSIITEHKHILR